jgi:hypothetical protein
MSVGSDDSNNEITAGSRPVSVSNDEWNQQTIVDARNVLQTQQSIEPSSPQYNEQRSVIGTITFYSF